MRISKIEERITYAFGEALESPTLRKLITVYPYFILIPLHNPVQKTVRFTYHTTCGSSFFQNI